MRKKNVATALLLSSYKFYICLFVLREIECDTYTQVWFSAF